MKESIGAKFQRLGQDIERDIYPGAGWLRKIQITLDFLWEKIRYNNELIDYVQYRFFYKKRPERQKFITHGKLVQIIAACNDPAIRPIFDQKPLFNQAFDAYLGREWLDAGTATVAQCLSFLERNAVFFAKVPDGMFGKGIQRIDRQELKDPMAFCQKAQADHLLLEGALTQHEAFREFNDTAVNSLRLVTLVTADGTPRVMAAVLRLSRRGKYADNFHHEGIASLIDIPTGLVCSMGVDREWRRYTLHPDSNKPIVGFQVPQWNQAVELVQKAALVHPEVRYVGWDVVITASGEAVLIEGNPGADPDVTQIPDQIGKWPLYEPLLREIQNR
ncbi:putative hexapeptide transferase family protein [Clostridiaceae bacterium JG1575]|nr:putative hexapeptide transferase family protein [Clostridiaceae bacterium JG1575]